MAQPTWITEFEQRNGTDSVQVNGRLFYPSGAWRDNAGEWSTWGDPELHAMSELEILNNQHIYHHERYQAAKREYDYKRMTMSSSIEHGFAPPEPEYKQLNDLETLVLERRRRLRQVKNQIDSHPENVLKKQAQAAKQKSLAKARARLDSFKI